MEDQKQESTEDDLISQIFDLLTRLTKSGLEATMKRCNDLAKKYEDNIIPHEDARFTFLLPRGIDKLPNWIDLQYPPFCNRQKTLLSLLNDCYANFTGYGQTKPKAAVIATSPGYGKTRLLAEWAIRVWHSAEVLQTFIENKTTMPENCKELKGILNEIISKVNDHEDSERQCRIKFLRNFYVTLKSSLILSVSTYDLSIKLTDANDANHVDHVTDMICRQIVCQNICRRFEGKQKVNGKELTIPRAWDIEENEDEYWLNQTGLLKKTLTNQLTTFSSLMHLFVDLVQSHPIMSIMQGDKFPYNLILVNIDEAQELLTRLTLTQVLAYHVMLQFYEFSRLNPEFKVHVLMVGLYGAELSKLQDPTRILTKVSLPLNPLFAEKYCRILCKSTIPNISAEGGDIVDILWRQCLGIPRVVQILHTTLQSFKEVLASTTIQAVDRKEIFEAFTTTATSYFNTGNSKPELSFTQRLLVELSLGLEKPQYEKIWENTTYAELESKGIILPIHFGPVDNQGPSRNYTLPFQFHGQNLMQKSSLIWQGDNPSAPFQHHPTTLAEIVGGDGSETDYTEQGAKLKVACAASLFARYQLQSVDQFTYVKVKDVITDWCYNNHYFRLNGVVEADHQIKEVYKTSEDPEKNISTQSMTFTAQLPKLKEASAIIINKAASQFADVLVPILILDAKSLKELQAIANQVKEKRESKEVLVQKESNYIRFLLIQCKNVQGKSEDIQPGKMVKDWNEHGLCPLMDAGHIFVLLAPNLPKVPLAERTKIEATITQLNKYKDQLVESNGGNWLSKLFLLTYSAKIPEGKAEPDTDLKPNTNVMPAANIEPKGEKRKAKKDVNPAPPKKKK